MNGQVNRRERQFLTVQSSKGILSRVDEAIISLLILSTHLMIASADEHLVVVSQSVT